MRIPNLKLLLLLFGIIYLFIFFYHSIKIITFPFGLDIGEGYDLGDATLLKNGLQIYTDIDEYPMGAAAYPPIFHLLSAVLMNIFGEDFISGRLVSFFSSLFIGISIFLIVNERTKSLYASTIGMLLFFASNYVYYWGAFFRVDMLAIFFSVAGMYFIVKYNSDKSLISIPFFILAIYTKQSMIAAPIASFIYLFFENKSRSFKFAFSLISIAGAVFLFLNSITSGQFYLHTIVYNMNEIYLIRAMELFYKFLILHVIIILFAFTVLIYYIKSNRFRHEPILYYLIFSFIISFTAGKEGSNVNYFIENIAILSILSGIILGTSLKSLEDSFQTLILVGMLLQMVLFIHIPYTNFGMQHSVFPPLGHTPIKGDIENGTVIQAYIKNSTGDILVEEAGFAVLNSKKVMTNPMVLNYLGKSNRWNSHRLVGDIESKKFSLIILNFDLFPSDVSQTIKENYELADTVRMCKIEYRILKPRLTHARDVGFRQNIP